MVPEERHMSASGVEHHTVDDYWIHYIAQLVGLPCPLRPEDEVA